MASPTLLYPLK